MKNNIQKQLVLLTFALVLMTLTSCSRNGSKSGGCPGELSVHSSFVSVLK